MSKLVKTLGKEIDKGTRKLDANTSKAIGMPEGVKISHAMDNGSAKHKEAVGELKGKDEATAAAAPAPAPAPESKPEEEHSSTYTASLTVSSVPNDHDGTTKEVKLTGASAHEGDDA